LKMLSRELKQKVDHLDLGTATVLQCKIGPSGAYFFD
jgi:hypothetical protein